MSITAPEQQSKSDDLSPQVRVNSYDEVPYSVGAFPQTQPDRLATIATLFGLNPVHPDHCRVLELGCAAGGNLVPMAIGSPESTFLGIDLSARQIADGNETLRALGIVNIRLEQQDILQFPRDAGEFDYILAHGVYSWVPSVVQQKILEVCQRHLAPHGIAYISYNTYPGWHARGAIREMLWYHTQNFPDPAVRIRQSRALLAFLTISTLDADGGYGALFRQELALLMQVPDTYLLHEHLEEFNEPLYFHQFAQRCAEHDLQYLGEAQIAVMMAARFGTEVEQTLRKISPDLLHMEQYMDFLRNRMFRQSLICRSSLKPDFTLRPQTLRQCHLASSAKNLSKEHDLMSNQPEEFRRSAAGPALSTHDPLMKAAMTYLGQMWPMPVTFDTLLHEAASLLGRTPTEADATALASRQLNCYTSGLVDLSLSKPKFTNVVSATPVASSYARLCARRGSKVTNMRLESAELGELSRLILSHLDGTRDREALVNLITEYQREKSLLERPIELVRQYVDELLPAFARAALLVT